MRRYLRPVTIQSTHNALARLLFLVVELVNLCVAGSRRVDGSVWLAGRQGTSGATQRRELWQSDVSTASRQR
jgi:hypothetical protein